MLEPRTIQLPTNIQAVYLQNCLKILAHLLSAETNGVTCFENGTEASEVGDPTTEVGDSENSNNGHVRAVNLEDIQEKLRPFILSDEPEVQERAILLFNVIKYFLKLESKGEWNCVTLGSDLLSLFFGELNPVAPKAQKKVPLPEGLDLDEWINEPPSSLSEDEEIQVGDVFGAVDSQSKPSHFYEKEDKFSQPKKCTEEELQKVTGVFRSLYCFTWVSYDGTSLVG